jgi:hypothetical protein
VAYAYTDIRRIEGEIVLETLPQHKIGWWSSSRACLASMKPEFKPNCHLKNPWETPWKTARTQPWVLRAKALEFGLR